MEKLLSVTFNINLTNNNNGQKKSWHKSHSDRKKFEVMIRRAGLTRKPFAMPTVVHVTRILGARQKLWDMSSGLRGNFKQLEDSLVACGWWNDDSPRWIKEVRFFQDDTQRDQGPAVLIEIFRG